MLQKAWEKIKIFFTEDLNAKEAAKGGNPSNALSCKATTFMGAKVCVRCGACMMAKKTLYCTNCGAVIPVNGKICNSCGKVVEGGLVMPLDELKRLKSTDKDA